MLFCMLKAQGLRALPATVDELYVSASDRIGPVRRSALPGKLRT